MKIVPIEAKGEPIDILGMTGNRDDWTITIYCNDEPHKLRLHHAKELELHHHDSEDIQAEESMAALANSPVSACACVRVNFGLSKEAFILSRLCPNHSNPL
jgi:hypothetical protein